MDRSIFETPLLEGLVHGLVHGLVTQGMRLDVVLVVPFSERGVQRLVPEVSLHVFLFFGPTILILHNFLLPDMREVSRSTSNRRKSYLESSLLLGKGDQTLRCSAT